MPTVPFYDFDTDFVLKVRQTIRVVQSDIGREFVCHAKFNGQKWDLTGFTGTVLGVKPDGNATDTTATIDEDEFKFTLTEQMAAVAGAYEIFLTVENGSDVKIQAPVLLCVLEGADGVISESALGALTELLQASQDALEDASDAATAAAASAEDAEDAADRAEAAADSILVNNTDRTPYLLRQSGGGVETGDREYDTIVGGTVAWNQLVASDYTSSSSGGVSFPIGAKVVSGHKYLSIATRDGAQARTKVEMYCKVNGANTNIGVVIDLPASGPLSGGRIFEATGTAVSDGTTSTGVWLYRNNYQPFDTITSLKLFDLTQMFGSTIADYIYSLEQATEGAGVAWFRKLFPNDYYEYNAGELLSVEDLQSHDMVGFNQFDKDNTISDSWVYRYYPVPIGATNELYMSFTDKDTSVSISGMYIGFCSSSMIGKSNISNTDSRWIISNGMVQNNKTNVSLVGDKRLDTIIIYPKTVETLEALTKRYDICVNLSGSRNGEYEPYKKYSYPLDDSLTLRGIPKLDANNELYYDGDTYESDGTVTRKYGVRAYQSGDESLADAITDGTNTVFKLTTPTTETAEPFTNPQVVDQNGTEQYVTDSIVPVGHDTRYRVNLLDNLNHILKAPTADGTYTMKVTVSNGEATYFWD